MRNFLKSVSKPQNSKNFGSRKSKDKEDFLGNKKAVEMNVNTIIVVVLAVLLLVVLSLYFTGGLKTLFQRIGSISTAYDRTDVENARNVCTIYCATEDKTSFCTHKFPIIFDKKTGKTDEIGCIGNEVTREKEDGTKEDLGFQDPIEAWKEPECKAAGFSKDSCST